MFEHFELVKQSMELHGFSPHTQEAYIRQIRFFLSYHKLPVEELNEEHVRDYLQFLIKTKNASRSMLATAYSGMKFFFVYALKKDFIMKYIPRSKKPKRLAVVLSQEEV